LAPQLVPGAWAAPSPQVCAPEAQEVMPAAQGLGLPVHDWPAVHAMQPPLPSQTLPAPHAVPAERLPKSSHTGAPVAQFVMPVLHGFGLSVQFVFAAQAPQVPVALQTMLAPQLDPAGLLVPSAQVCAPVAHDVMPALHGFGLAVHDCPEAQATQPPLLSQTMPTPQLEPGARFTPSAQVVALPLQLVVPCLQTLTLPVQL
jgi:hypothetical protein